MAATLTLDRPGPVRPGDVVVVDWAGIDTPTPIDWIAMYPRTSPPGSWTAGDPARMGWNYTGGGASGRMPIPIATSVVPGPYEVRLYANSSYVLLASVLLDVSAEARAPTPTPTPTPTPEPTPTPTLPDLTGLLKKPAVVIGLVVAGYVLLGGGRKGGLL